MHSYDLSLSFQQEEDTTYKNKLRWAGDHLQGGDCVCANGACIKGAPNVQKTKNMKADADGKTPCTISARSSDATYYPVDKNDKVKYTIEVGAYDISITARLKPYESNEAKEGEEIFSGTLEAGKPITGEWLMPGLQPYPPLLPPSLPPPSRAHHHHTTTHIHTRTHTHTHTHTLTHAHTHIHTYTHTHIHTAIPLPLPEHPVILHKSFRHLSSSPLSFILQLLLISLPDLLAWSSLCPYRVVCSGQGLLEVEFDNRKSMLRSKTVKYQIGNKSSELNDSHQVSHENKEGRR